MWPGIEKRNMNVPGSYFWIFSSRASLLIQCGLGFESIKENYCKCMKKHFAECVENRTELSPVGQLCFKDMAEISPGAYNAAEKLI